MDNNKEEYIFIGNLYHCSKCRKLRGIIKGEDYSKEEYEELSDKYQKEFQKPILSAFLPTEEEKNKVCPNCQ